ncbi:MAG: hypothetical protein O2955_13270 [Planctomycetota bacterium]|nr:hypothetical protein [Planctomycetota bacterium]MDA1213481.1 hypothetical protein [Planctomycetota bacterium]
MNQALPFGDILEAVDRLPLEEQEELIAIVNRRVAEAARQRLIEEVRQAEREYADGLCKPASVEEIMREITK